jgi:hypothetical protein
MIEEFDLRWGVREVPAALNKGGKLHRCNCEYFKPLNLSGFCILCPPFHS